MKKGLLILGNQLFERKHLPFSPGEGLVFMREDMALCTHFRYHKQKIAFFLLAMRKYAQELRSQGYEVHYEDLQTQKERHTYSEAFAAFLKKEKISEIHLFEIEDKFFEKEISLQLQDLKVEVVTHQSPLFLNSREDFKNYLSRHKKPFMKVFYEEQRKKWKVLLDSKGQPLGGQWSFDQDNRKKLPASYRAPEISFAAFTGPEREILNWVNKTFPDHPGDALDMWLPTHRQGARQWLAEFLEKRFHDFGPYEDALSSEYPFVNHSVLTTFLNVGLLTPREVLGAALRWRQSAQTSLASTEGFVRQVMGWREFVRGIYQNFSEVQDEKNFFCHERHLKNLWYTGGTGIPPLDDVIEKTLRYGYAHHIERLMVVGSLMLLLEICPSEAHRWFMEMFIDSSDWVMGPNVYGMALFSDGGIFATKPYFCGSNYYRKMGSYKTGDWQAGVDGLYWSFIDKNRNFFLKNPRLSMAVRTYDKMPEVKRRSHLEQAQLWKEKLSFLPSINNGECVDKRIS